jgi:hypothetical protein
MNTMPVNEIAPVVPLPVKDIVLAFIKAVNDDDLTTARSFVWDHMIFTGVLSTRNGADNYFEDLGKMQFKYDIKKVFAEGEDVCVLYDFTISGLCLFACGWYQVHGGKISAIQIIYDPRPVLDLSA